MTTLRLIYKVIGKIIKIISRSIHTNTFEQHRIKRIKKAQKREIKRLNDRKYANRVGNQKYYCEISNYVKMNQKVLEIGCGPGAYVSLMSSLGANIVGIDPHSFEEWNFLKKDRVTLQKNIRAEKLPFNDDEFELVTMLGTLLYLEEPIIGLNEAHRVLKPGGYFIVRNVNASNLYTRRTGKLIDPASKNVYELDELISRIKKCGFQIEKFYSFGFWPPYFNRLWWYIAKTLLPISFHNLLSNLTPKNLRINLIVVAKKMD